MAETHSRLDQPLDTSLLSTLFSGRGRASTQAVGALNWMTKHNPVERRDDKAGEPPSGHSISPAAAPQGGTARSRAARDRTRERKRPGVCAEAKLRLRGVLLE